MLMEKKWKFGLPEDIEVGTKLWGQAAELQRTVDFLAATGLGI